MTRIDRRIRLLALWACTISPVFLLVFSYTSGSLRLVTTSGIAVIAGCAGLVVLALSQHVRGEADNTTRILNLRIFIILTLQLLAPPQAILGSQILSVTVWDASRLLSLPRMTRLFAAFVPAELILSYLGPRIPIGPWYGTTYTLLGGLWASAVFAGLVGYILQLRWIEAQRKDMLLDRNRESTASLARTIIELQDYAMQAEDEAVRRQRTYVAREIHDHIGHTLTCLIVLLGAGEKQLAEGDDAGRTLSEARAMARRGLDDARALVDVFRVPLPERPRGRSEWMRLIESFAEITRVEARIDITEDYEDIPPQIDDTIYRAIQEALTNAYRHGHASVIDVAVWWEEDVLYMRFSDNGHGAYGVVEGNGLQGMRERLAPLEGELAYRSVPGRGFDLGVEIPWRRGSDGANHTGTDR